MSPLVVDSSWIWHPDWVERPTSRSAGGFIHFRNKFHVSSQSKEPVLLRVSADTRYKLHVNAQEVLAGPVKGDGSLWFYDDIDIRPYLQHGWNLLAIRVLRFFYATNLATSFPRTPFGGLLVQQLPPMNDTVVEFDLSANETWETAIDTSVQLLNEKHNEDHFLHIYETSNQHPLQPLEWKPAKPYKFLTSFGLQSPWNLAPRAIPLPKRSDQRFIALHNVTSVVPVEDWQAALISSHALEVVLTSSTKHHVELEMESHTTATLKFRFARPSVAGSSIRLTYSESYLTSSSDGSGDNVKGDRCNYTGRLVGPQDTYIFKGPCGPEDVLGYEEREDQDEVYATFHFRTFRFLAMDISVSEGSPLLLKSIEVTKTTYPLNPTARFEASSAKTGELQWVDQLWKVSMRTLENCMHDCYEDCPFYEQLQYAMDTRSSALFTYHSSGDNRLARQAILQLRNSFDPVMGLTASRAPSHHKQIIPTFSLFWICMVADYYQYHGDPAFVLEVLPVCCAVLETFHSRVDEATGLVRVFDPAKNWDFVDWTEAWKPFGIPPAAQRTGFLTFASALYSYTLRSLATVLQDVQRGDLAATYEVRATSVSESILRHCFDGQFFTDGLSEHAVEADYSEHSQVWAVLSGTVVGERGADLLKRTLQKSSGHKFTPTSVAMSFYTLRSMSLVGGELYNEHFHDFWNPWRAQLEQNVTTWVEDPVSQRSDCHAWGSAPIYEFMAEVAGVSPASPGWGGISFRPRISLFESLDARVPVQSLHGAGIAVVKWRKDTVKGGVTIQLDIEFGHEGPAGADVLSRYPTSVNIPGLSPETVYGPGPFVFQLPSRDA